MDKIDSKDQLFSNLRTNNLKWHILYLILLISINNMKQFDYSKIINVFGYDENEEGDTSNIPQFLNNKSAVVSVIASLGLFYYIRLLGKTMSSNIMKNDLWNNDPGVYSILNIPITVTAFIIITITIMIILRLLHYHIGGVYIEKNTYKNVPQGIILTEDDRITMSNENRLSPSPSNPTDIILSSPISNGNGSYTLTTSSFLKVMFENNKEIWNLNKQVNKISFIDNHVIFMDRTNNEVHREAITKPVNNPILHLTPNGNLVILNKLITNPSETNVLIKENYDIIWQSIGNIKHIPRGNNSNNYIVTHSRGEVDNTNKLVSRNGTYELFIDSNKMKIIRSKDTTSERVFWYNDLPTDTTSIKINENGILTSSTNDQPIPGFENIKIKYMELKDDGNLVIYDKSEKAIWMTREGLFKGKGFNDITLPYLIYALGFYLIESVFVKQKWYIGIVRKAIRTFYLLAGFIVFSAHNGLTFSNIIPYLYMFGGLMLFMLWKTKDYANNSNKKSIVYIISFSILSAIYLIINLIRKITLFPTEINKNWSNDVDDIESNIFSTFYNYEFKEHPARYIFFIIMIMLTFPLLLFAFNKPNLFQDNSSNLKNKLGNFLNNKFMMILFGLWTLFNILFAIVPNVTKKARFERNLIYAIYHKWVGFLAICSCALYLLYKTFSEKNDNNYYNLLIISLSIFCFSKFVEYPSIKFYFQNREINRNYYLTPNALAKNNLIRIINLIVSFFAISYLIFNDSNTASSNKLSMIFLLFSGFFITILSLVYQHLYYDSKQPQFDPDSNINKINFLSWKNSTNNICNSEGSFNCKKFNNKTLNLRDYSCRLPLILSLIALIIYSLFKNNSKSYYINVIFIIILYTFITGVNFAEGGNLFNLNILNISQSYDKISSPLFSFFISFINSGYIKFGIGISVFLVLLFVYLYIKKNKEQKLNNLGKTSLLLLCLLFFIAPLITNISLTYNNNNLLEKNTILHDTAKTILTTKDNNYKDIVNNIKWASLLIPSIISGISLLLLLWKTFSEEQYIVGKFFNIIIILAIVFLSFTYGRFVGLMNADPTELEPNLKIKINNMRHIEQHLNNNLSGINVGSTIQPIPITSIQNNYNNYFYLYFHGIDLINREIIKNTNDFIPPIYRVNINLDNVEDNINLQEEIQLALEKMKNWYSLKYEVDININFINHDNKYKFVLYNYEIASNKDELFDNNNAAIVKSGIKFKGKYLNHENVLNDYGNIIMNSNYKTFYTNYKTNTKFNTINEKFYLDTNYNIFFVIFDPSTNIAATQPINTANCVKFESDNDTLPNSIKNMSNNPNGNIPYSSNKFNIESRLFADDTLNNIIATSNSLPPTNIKCVKPTNCPNENRWLDLYNYYYYNKKYNNEIYNTNMSEMYEGRSNIFELLKFPNRNIIPSINKALILKSPISSATTAIDYKRFIKNYYINCVESTDNDLDIEPENEKSTRQSCPVPDSFTDFNYNFKL